jgi:hypothetical protein
VSVACSGDASSEEVRMLLAKSPPLRRDVLHYAADSATDGADKVRALLDRDATLIDSLGADATTTGPGCTPLHGAVYGWRLQAVRELIARGANPDIKTTKKWRGGRRGETARQMLEERAATKADASNPKLETALRDWSALAASLPAPRSPAKR